MFKLYYKLKKHPLINSEFDSELDDHFKILIKILKNKKIIIAKRVKYSFEIMMTECSVNMHVDDNELSVITFRYPTENKVWINKRPSYFNMFIVERIIF